MNPSGQNPNNSTNPASPPPVAAGGATPLNREFAAQNLGNSLTETNARAATTLSGYDQSKKNIYSVSMENDSNNFINPASYPQNSLPNGQDLSNQFPVNTPGQTEQFQQNTANLPNPANQSGQSAHDYLNEISSGVNQKKSLLSGKVLFIGGALVAIATIVIIIAIAAGNVAQNAAKPALAVGDELTNLQTLLTYGQTNRIATTKTTKVMAEASLISQSRRKDLAKNFALTSQTGGTTQTKPSFIATLDAAKSSGNLESVYQTTLTNQLNAVSIALQDLNKQNPTVTGAAAIAKTEKDIAELARRLKE